jgi:hypothetical protein
MLMKTSSWLGIAVFFLSICVASAGSAAGSPLLFLDPDANHDVILDVMKQFDALFEKSSLGLYFQPIQTEAAAGAQDDVTYGIISPEYEQVWKRLGLQPILVPESNGSAYFHKALVSQAELAKDLGGMVVAAAVAQERTEEVKALLAKHGYGAGSPYILAVGKDIDAMLAVSFGEANAALVTSESLAVLKQVNPNAAAHLRTLLITEPQLRAPLCRQKRLSGNALQDDKLAQVFLHLPDSPEGQQILQLMSVTRWVTFSQAKK